MFPSEARYVGEHGTTSLEQVFHPRPGEHMAEQARAAGWRRIGVYGLDYIMAVRDYQALEGLELVPFDLEFDLARAVKSEAELESVRDSVRINQRGFELWYEAYAPGKTAAEVMAAAEEWFIAEGCGRLTMNMVLTGTDTFARPEFKIARSDEVLRGVRAALARGRRPGDALGRGLARRPRRRRRAVRRHEADAGGVHGVLRGGADGMHAGASCHDVHMAVSRGFHERGYRLGHVTGHSIGMTMIEFPKVGEGVEIELQENMVLSMHPHAIAANGEDCLYMQDTWLVTPSGGVPLAELAMEIWVAGARSRLATPALLTLGRRTRRYTVTVSWPWIVLLAIGIGIVVAAEWPRFERLVGADARRQREREKRKAKLRVVVDGRRRVRPQRPGRPRGAADDRGARDPH